MKEVKKHLIIAPHHDDEVIACGGTIAKAVNNNEQVKIIIITKGDLSLKLLDDKDIEFISNIRNEESVNACNVLGVKREDIKFIKKGDRTLIYSLEFVKEIIHEILEFKPNIIYYPHSLEGDRDHKVVNEVVSEAIFLCKSGFINEDGASYIQLCLQYEVWTPMMNYNIAKDITKFADLKKDAISKYKSQLKKLNLAHGILGLNSYRGMQIGVPFAEVFKI
ncbi:MAG: PIG-L family deacetylase [Defluviitaleaceae bacterium]|nr:PIG-L family deacetylase [Defluviitaleaceae bacterium]